MHIKIYFGDKPVFLCDELNNELREILHHPDAVFIDETSNAGIKSLLHEIVKDEFHAGVLLHPDLPVLKKAFFRHFKEIEAAGGIVENEAKELLLIYRLDKWDLPKGKVEDGEGITEAAIREVEEETGVRNLVITGKAGETYHTYNAYGKHFIKTTHWFNMSCPSGQQVVPQTEEGIAEIRWAGQEAIVEAMQNTYPSIRDILTTAARA